MIFFDPQHDARCLPAVVRQCVDALEQLAVQIVLGERRCRRIQRACCGICWHLCRIVRALGPVNLVDQQTQWFKLVLLHLGSRDRDRI